MGNKKRNTGQRSTQSKSKSGTSSSHGTESYKSPDEIKKVTKKADEGIRKATVEKLLQERPLSYEKIDRVHSYWNSISIDLKKKFLRPISICDLKCLFESSREVNGLMATALTYIQARRQSKIWFCCHCKTEFPDSDCNTEFPDSESHRQHVVQEHVGNLSPEMQRLLPKNVDDGKIQMIRHCPWKPLDASGAVKMLEDQAKCKSEERNIAEGVEVERRSAEFSAADCWPLSDDSDRAARLKKIHGGLNTLIRHKYLADSLLSKVIKFSMDEISKLAAGSQLLNHALDQSLTSICFLGAPQLEKIYRVLLQVSHSCDLVMNDDKSTDPIDDLQNSNQTPGIEEKIVLNEDASYLLLDECLVPAEITPGATESAAMDNVITPTPSDVVLPSADPFLSWIFSGSSCWDQLNLCVGITTEDNRRQGLELVKTLKKEFDILILMCKKKRGLMDYEEALQVVEDLCLEEGKRKNFIGSVLRVRKEELIKGKKHDGNDYELDAITDVLRVVEAVNANQMDFTCEENYTGAFDLECQMDNYIVTEAIMQLREETFMELSMIDGEILKMVAEMRQLELELDSISVFDYRRMFLPLVKAYLRKTLEDSAEKDAKEKSDAAAEALLADLALESKKGVKGGSDGAKDTEKTKNKKRNREKRKTRDLKATCVVDTTTPDSSSAARDNDPDSIPDDLEQVKLAEQQLLEEEALRKMEEEEMKKRAEQLEEKVGLQRRIEKEAKLNRLAEKQKELRGEEERRKLELEEEESKLAENEAKQKRLAEQQKELREEEGRLKIELEEKKAKLAENEAKQKWLAEQQKELEQKEERGKIKLEEKKVKLAENKAEQKRLAEQQNEFSETNLEMQNDEVLDPVAEQQKESSETNLEKPDDEVLDPVAEQQKESSEANLEKPDDQVLDPVAEQQKESSEANLEKPDDQVLDPVAEQQNECSETNLEMQGDEVLDPVAEQQKESSEANLEKPDDEVLDPVAEQQKESSETNLEKPADEVLDPVAEQPNECSETNLEMQGDEVLDPVAEQQKECSETNLEKPDDKVLDPVAEQQKESSETNLEKPDDEVLDPGESRPSAPGSEPSNE